MKLFKHVKLYHWPRIASLWFLSAIIIPYIIATSNGHVQYYLPFISDCGTIPPESCVFAQMLNIGALSTAVLAYIRYKQVAIGTESTKCNLSRKWNTASLWCAMYFALGISIVANFQETSLLSVHLIGGAMAFFGMGVFLIIQTRISLAFSQIEDKYDIFKVPKSTLYVRVLLMALYWIFLASTIYFCGELPEHIMTSDKVLYWSKDEPFYETRIRAAFSEWLMTFSFAFYVLTATKEFKSIEFDGINFRSKFEILNGLKNKKGK